MVDNANITDYISVTVNLGILAYIDSILLETNDPSHMTALNSISVIVKHYNQGGRYTASDFDLDENPFDLCVGFVSKGVCEDCV